MAVKGLKIRGPDLDVVGGLFGEHPGDGPCHFERVPQAPHEADPAEALHAGSRESLRVGPFYSFFLSLESLHSVALSQPISANLGPVG